MAEGDTDPVDTVAKDCFGSLLLFGFLNLGVVFMAIAVGYIIL